MTRTSSPLLVRAPIALLALGAACTGGLSLGPGHGVYGSPPSNLACPVDPDCAIGGDCAIYVCPSHWECEEDRGTVVCWNPGPEYPDGSGDWECFDRDGQTVCRSDDYPDGGAGSRWNCEESAEFVECTSDDPSYPDGGSGAGWDCEFSGELRVCVGEGGDYPGDGGDGPGDGGDGPGDGGDGPGDGGDGPGDGPDFPDDGDYPESMCEFGEPEDCRPGRTECTADVAADAVFMDDRDGEEDGQIVALGDRAPHVGCASVTVGVTGFYQIYDMELSESCTSQRDETGYLTIRNSCNTDGWAVERNAGPRFVVPDTDNTNNCSSDADCGPGTVCRDSEYSRPCCVPDAPVFMGTFLLLAGEPNEVCINHWCPDYLAMGSPDDGTTNAGCTGSVNSIHLRLDSSVFLCVDETLDPVCDG